MNEISDDRIAQSLLPYGVSVDAIFCSKLRDYVSILLKWNKTISLTTVTDPSEIIKFHFGESLLASSAVPIQKGRLADVGSGAGFPGLPLAMAILGLHATLIESNLKKCAFLSEAVRTLNLPHVDILHDRMEDISSRISSLDFITARALGQHDELLSWAKVHLSESGKIVLWLGEDDVEVISKRTDWHWQDRMLIPGSKRRFILAGSVRR